MSTAMIFFEWGVHLLYIFEREPVSDLQAITILIVATTLPEISRALGKEKGKGTLYLWSKNVWRLILE